MSATHPYVLIDPVCGKPAIRRVSIPKSTDRLDDMEAHAHIDGRPVQGHEAIVCDSCGGSLISRVVGGALLNPELWRRDD